MTEYGPANIPIQQPLPAEMAGAADPTQVNPMSMTAGELDVAMREIGERIAEKEALVRQLLDSMRADEARLRVLKLVREGKAAGALPPGPREPHEITETDDGRLIITGGHAQVPPPAEGRIIDAAPGAVTWASPPPGPYPPRPEYHWNDSTVAVPQQQALPPAGQPDTFYAGIDAIVRGTLARLDPVAGSEGAPTEPAPQGPPTAEELARLYAARVAAARGRQLPAHAAPAEEAGSTDPQHEEALRDRAARLGSAVAAVRYVRQAPDTGPATPAAEPPVQRRPGEQTFVDGYRPVGTHDVFALARTEELRHAAELRRRIEAELAQAHPDHAQINAWQQEVAALERDNRTTSATGAEDQDQASLLRRVIKGLEEL